MGYFMVTTQGCSHCHSFQTTGFNLLSDSNQQKLSNVKQSRRFLKGEHIFLQGEKVQHVYCIRSGLVKLESIGADGHSLTVGFMRGGDLLGLGGVLSQSPSAFSATIIEDASACSFSADLFRQILTDSPALALRYLTGMFTELRETRQRLLNGVDKDVPARVAEALVYLKANYPDHTFTRKEIAEWAGTTTESVIRTLSHFEDEGLIAQVGRKITITDSQRLSLSAGALI
jgi:CRP-like cAMP-binding protein